MSESFNNESAARPSAGSAFLSGGMSGLVSGAVMTLVVATVLAVMPAALGGVGFFAALTHTAPLMIAASTIFGGVMAAKRAVFDAPSPAKAYSGDHDIVPVPVSVGMAPAIAAAPVLADAAPDSPPKNWAIDAAPEADTATKNWVASTGRNDGAQSTIQQILADGSLSDKDRASAILASRTSADGQASRA